MLGLVGCTFLHIFVLPETYKPDILMNPILCAMHERQYESGEFLFKVWDPIKNKSSKHDETILRK